MTDEDSAATGLDALDALDALNLPTHLDGEDAALTAARWTVPTYYSPDGESLPDALWESWERIYGWKEQPGNYRRTEFAVEGSAECAVSTVYLGLNLQFSAGRPILIWETMIFGGPADLRQWRYSTRAAAMRGHQAIVDTLAVILGYPPRVEVPLPGLVFPQREDRA